MFHVRTFALIAIALFGILHSTAAQQPVPAPNASPSPAVDKRTLIRDLMDVTGSRKTASDVYESMLAQQSKILSEILIQTLESNAQFQLLTDADKESMKKKVIENSNNDSAHVKQLFDARINFPQLVEDISYQLYDKYFTEAELQDLLTFYRTPSGKKAIEVGPKMFNESMTISVERVRPHMAEIMMILQKEESDRLNKELEGIKANSPAKTRPARRPRKKG